jgi:pyruvate dehydrogenase E2 component (dihydrolipoamide acetyltransferase)
MRSGRTLPGSGTAHRHRHSPRVRRLAREHGIELAALTGTGPHERVTPADVLRAAAPRPLPPGDAAPPAPPPGIAVVEVDMTRAQRLAAAQQVPPEVPLAAAVLAALRRHPSLLPGTRLHLGVRTGGPQDRLTVIPDAGDLSMAGLARRLTAPQAGTAATFTLSTGLDGGLLFQVPQVPAGQVAALAAGAAVQRPAVVPDRDGDPAVTVRLVCHLCLAYDAGTVGAAGAAAFLQAVRDRLTGAGTTQ